MDPHDPSETEVDESEAVPGSDAFHSREETGWTVAPSHTTLSRDEENERYRHVAESIVDTMTRATTKRIAFNVYGRFSGPRRPAPNIEAETESMRRYANRRGLTMNRILADQNIDGMKGGNRAGRAFGKTEERQ